MAFCVVNTHRGNFTQVPNNAMLTLLRKNHTKAFGLYVFMGSKPDKWVFKTSWIAKQLCWSEKTVERAMKILIQEGYLRRTQRKSPDGKFFDMQYDLYYDPQEQEETCLVEELTLPVDYFTICENPATPEYVQYALSLLNEEDRSFLRRLYEMCNRAYYQILLKVVTSVDSHSTYNPEGYAIAVLANEIKQAKRSYSVVLKGSKKDAG